MASSCLEPVTNDFSCMLRCDSCEPNYRHEWARCNASPRGPHSISTLGYQDEREDPREALDAERAKVEHAGSQRVAFAGPSSAAGAPTVEESSLQKLPDTEKGSDLSRELATAKSTSGHAVHDATVRAKYWNATHPESHQV